MSAPLTVSVEDDAPPADAQVVLDGLRAFNVAVIGDPAHRPVSVLARDGAGMVRGGLLGDVRWRWLHVAKLWVPVDLRGQGLGRRLLRAAEDRAWQLGCLGAYLETFEFQARSFYEKEGYTVYGTLDDYPPGYRQYHLKKSRPAEMPRA